MKAASALAALVVCIGAGPASAPLLLREQAWTAPGERLAYDVTHAPGECLAAQSLDIEIGRALFRSPGLLGGPAARLGLSCQACHGNGRVNARFLLPELTDRPGHADVTSEWASASRGDGVFNPVLIPDLVDVAQRSAFGHAREPSLEAFVRGVIVEEFQGEPPPAQALAGVLAYLRALRREACTDAVIPITLETAADDVRRALEAALAADAATTPLLFYATQDAMGRIVERLPAASFRQERAALETLSRELGRMRAMDARMRAMTAEGWRVRFDAAIARVAPRKRETFFDEATVAAALAPQG